MIPSGDIYTDQREAAWAIQRALFPWEDADVRRAAMIIELAVHVAVSGDDLDTIVEELRERCRTKIAPLVRCEDEPDEPEVAILRDMADHDVTGAGMAVGVEASKMAESDRAKYVDETVAQFRKCVETQLDASLRSTPSRNDEPEG